MANLNKVLVVDDEAPVRELFTDLLKAEKYNVKTVSSGEEALQAVDGESFDVVLLDIKLGGISGIETLKTLKEKKPDVIVIMITGFGYDEDLIAKSKEYGCSGYIGKNMPISQIMSNFRLFVNATQERLKKDK
ncbi:MAG: response regulator [Candidatus Omnitrophica bacterium]|nr:response regulator [Candidatus Omnitrophota bacterium]MDD5512705.1 response regulator [Candidatus Omnitrophota bacterium]